MDGIKQQIQARQIETMNNKHIYETKKLAREMRSELDKLREQNKSAVADIKKNYERESLAEKNKLEVELTGIRKKNNKLIKDEESRFKKMIEELKVTHSQKMTELKIAQEREAEKVEQDHKDHLETTRMKYEEQIEKLEA